MMENSAYKLLGFLVYSTLVAATSTASINEIQLDGFGRCLPDQAMAGCCLLKTGSSLVCRHECPIGFYNVTSDVVFNNKESVAAYSHNHLATPNVEIDLLSSGVVHPSNILFCRPCHISCARCVHGGDTVCLACAEGYRPSKNRLCRQGFEHRENPVANEQWGFQHYLYVFGTLAFVVGLVVLVCFFTIRHTKSLTSLANVSNSQTDVLIGPNSPDTAQFPQHSAGTSDDVSDGLTDVFLDMNTTDADQPPIDMLTHVAEVTDGLSDAVISTNISNNPAPDQVQRDPPRPVDDMCDGLTDVVLDNNTTDRARTPRNPPGSSAAVSGGLTDVCVNKITADAALVLPMNPGPTHDVSDGAKDILPGFSSSATSTKNKDTAQLPTKPMFSKDWELESFFAPFGGNLQGEQSDVTLVVPAGAVRDHHLQRVLSAVGTDLQQVHSQLQLDPDTHVVSPVAEFYAEGVQFSKPVTVALPHFLPPSCVVENEADIAVYQIERQEDGGGNRPPRKMKLKLCPKSAAGGSGTCYLEGDRVYIFTDHFTGFVCTVCKKEKLPCPLVLEVWAKHCPELETPGTKPGTTRVEVRLHVWIGARFKVLDFRRKILDVSALINYRGMKAMDLQQLDEYRLEKDGQTSTVWLQGKLRPSDTTWSFYHDPDSGPIYPQAVAKPITRLFACECASPYEEIKWQLTTTNDVKLCSCDVKVGYVTDTGELLLEPKSVVTSVQLNIQKRDSKGDFENSISSGMGSLCSSLGEDVDIFLPSPDAKTLTKDRSFPATTTAQGQGCKETGAGVMAEVKVNNWSSNTGPTVINIQQANNVNLGNSYNQS